jgi:hypothetical protein
LVLGLTVNYHIISESLFQIISGGFGNNVQNFCGLFRILHILSKRLRALSDEDFQRA